MKENLTSIKKFFKISDEDVLMIVLAFFCFSMGIWINYRQLWLQDIVGFNLKEISNIISVALICSSIISFVISLFSTKVRTKNVIIMSMLFRCLALAALFRVSDKYLIKTFMLLSIMCETIFSIAFYPLITTVNKSEETYRKHALISYVAKDAAVVFCGLLLGVTVGKIIFDLNTCLFIALISNILGTILLLLFETDKVYQKNKILPLKKAFKKLFESKSNNWYLFTLFIVNISYGMIFGLVMLILTTYIGFEISFASIFIIVSNIIGSVLCSYFNNHCSKISVRVSVLIKYGIRCLSYFVAFFSNNIPMFIMSIIIAYITSRIFEDKVTGTYVRRIKTDSQFLFGNIRYFISCIGEGLGIYLAGCLLNYQFKYLFLGAAVFTLIQILFHFELDSIKEK